jgi:hypothetical protein
MGKSSSSLHLYSMTYGSKLMFVETRPRTGRVVRLPRHNRAVTRAPGCSPMSNHKRQNVAFGSCPCQKLLFSVAEMSIFLIQPKAARIDLEAIRQCPTGFGFRCIAWSRRYSTTQHIATVNDITHKYPYKHNLGVRGPICCTHTDTQSTDTLGYKQR